MSLDNEPPTPQLWNVSVMTGGWNTPVYDTLHRVQDLHIPRSTLRSGEAPYSYFQTPYSYFQMAHICDPGL